MKISNLGKIWFGYTAYRVASAYMEKKEQDEREREGRFSEAEVRELAVAAESGNFNRFKELYTFRRPWTEDSNLAETFYNFARIMKN